MSICSGYGIKGTAFLCSLSGVILALVFSAAFIYAHVDHDCFGEDCPVCLQIQGAQNLLKYLGFTGAGLFLIFLGRETLVLPRPPFLATYPSTIIHLKVRLNT